MSGSEAINCFCLTSGKPLTNEKATLPVLLASFCTKSSVFNLLSIKTSDCRSKETCCANSSASDNCLAPLTLAATLSPSKYFKYFIKKIS